MKRMPNRNAPGLLQQITRHWDDFLRGRLGRWVIGARLQRTVVAVFLVIRGFVANRGPTRAAALSYTTLLALVPLLAVMLSVSKNFLKESSADIVPKLIDRAVDMVAPQLELMPMSEETYGPPAPGQGVVSSQARAEMVAKIQEFIDSIDAGALGTVGTFFLVVIAIRLLTTIENTFNDIWGVSQGRSLVRKVVYYWSTVTLGPLLIVLAVYLTGKIEYMKAYGEWIVGAAYLKRFFLNLTPFAVLWLAFTAMYAMMPNTHVRLKSAFIGGVVGGTLWQLNSLLSTIYVSRVVTYSKLYGSLGIIPIFLVGLYFSWLIILFGAQVSFAAQNIHAYLQQRASERVDQRGRERVACQLMWIATEHFVRGQPAPTIEEIATGMEVPVHLLNQVVHRLRTAGLISEVDATDGGVLPARSPDAIRVADVLEVMRTDAVEESGPSPGDRPEPRIAELLDELKLAANGSKANLTFRALVPDDQPSA